MSLAKQKPLKLGIVMAGAVSAGAYTGGVMDYFFQAMDNWEKAKASNDPSIPRHVVRLDILSGASAGGMTCGMSAAALQRDRCPITEDKRSDEEYKKQNVLYNAWVNLLQDDMFPLLLDTGDIDKEGKLVSLLNSEFIPKIAERELNAVKSNLEAIPNYVNNQMEVVLTLSNLIGFDYKLFFKSEVNTYHSMTQFRDYAFFKLGREYENDGRIPLDIHANIGVTELCQATPATGAFPVGLAYRKLVRKRKYIFDNEDLITKTPFSQLAEINNSATNNEEDFVSYHVDGGMLNNEPFDLTLKLMAKIKQVPGQPLDEPKIEEESFESTIIMIDPFPSLDRVTLLEVGAEEQKDLKKEDRKGFENFPFSLTQVIGKIYRSMRGELLFKGEDIIEAFNNKNFSRFLIAPKRRDQDGTPGGKVYEGSVAIACGALDGFGGFFDKRFREHDFYLGRVNCQSFFRKHFAIRLDESGVPVNPIFRAGYSAEAIEKFKFEGDDGAFYIPIIPDITFDDAGKPIKNAVKENPMAFPQYNMKNFDNYNKAIQSRMKAVGNHLIPSGFLRTAFNGAFFIKKGAWVRKVKDTVEKGFRAWQLVK